MTKEKGFDLASIDTVAACNKSVEVEIKHPVTGAGTGVFFSVLGKDSDVWRGLVRDIAGQALKRRAAGKAVQVDLDKAEKMDIDALIAITKGWRTGDKQTVTLGGEDLEFNPANARRVYEALLPVREQVTEAVNSLENFMPA
jgi:hypothetical protein